MPQTRRRAREQAKEGAKKPPPSKRRVVTSAIPDMSVTEVRRALDSIRKRWLSRDDATQPPFVISAPLDVGSREMRVDEFTFQFILGHHRKRHAKAKNNHP